MTPTSNAALDSRRTWVRAAGVGTYNSPQGAITLSSADLVSMARAFRADLLVDWEGRSLAPKSPGDGAASGWGHAVQLRRNGTELWVLTTFTDTAAAAIRKGTHRYVMPVLRKDESGCTLTSLALTNTGHVDGLRSVIMCSKTSHVAHEVPASPEIPMAPTQTISLAETNQVVTFLPNPDSTPELSNAERAASYRVVAVRGLGDDQFVKLAHLDDPTNIYGWFPTSTLQPARAAKGAPTPFDHVKTVKDDTMRTNNSGINAAAVETAQAFLLTATRAYLKEHPTETLASAAKAVALRHREVTAVAYPSTITGLDADASVNTSVISLRASSQPGTEDFDTLAMRLSREQGIPLRDAVHRAGLQRPDLAARR